MRLQQRQARETGICPVRRELYSQTFDELIRQITIECAERGLLLLRCVSVYLSLHVYLLVSHVAQSHVKYAHGEIGTGNETMYVCMYLCLSVYGLML